MRTNLRYITLSCIAIWLFSGGAAAQEIDSLRQADLPVQDSLHAEIPPTPLDTVRLDTLKTQKQALLTDQVIYHADDYMRLSRKENQMYLYDNAKITYGDITLEAGLIILNNTKNEVYAYGIVDSTGYHQKPVFTQGQRVVKPDSIRFNFDTEKALIYNSRTEESAFKVKAETVKRQNDSVYYMKNVKLTTSEDIDNPEYYFYARKIKFVPQVKIVSGLVNMYIADVPTPLGLPFGYFPLTDDRASGFVIPSFGESRRGYFLQNGGYYFAINDYVDLTALGDYYTNGSYGMRLFSNYRMRYRFSGNLAFRYEKLLESERGFPDFSESTIYNIQWSHRQDQKANPTSVFSASVNLGSSRYYQESFNQINTGNVLNNTLNSSISYSKTFPGEPQVNLNLVATHTQNSNTGEINMSLPTLDASISRIYPFQPKSGTKKGAIQNINFQYSLRGENRFNTYDSLFFKPEMFEKALVGFKHAIPLNTNFKVFDFFSVSMGTSYNENWVFKTYEQSYDPQLQQAVTDTINGFDSYRTYNFNTSVGTTVYGMFNFGKDKKIQAVRHVMRPSISYNINPAFDQYYDEYVVPGTGGMEDRVVSYSRFQGTLFGAPGKNYSSSIGFSLSNNFEAKVRAKDSLDTEPRKIDLLKNLNFSTAYNLASDSLNWSPVRFSGALPILQDKLTINFGGNLDPYALDNNNQRINKFNIENGGSLFRLTDARISFDYSFSSSDFIKGEKENADELANKTFQSGGRPDDLFGKPANLEGSFEDEEEEQEPKVDNTPWYNYMPKWNVNLAYTASYNNRARQNEISNHSLMFSGDIELAPRWTVGVSSGYDFVNQGFTYTQFRFERDLKSWRMSFNWRPFGRYESWYFFIGIKASVLSDIKYDKHREPNRQL